MAFELEFLRLFVSDIRKENGIDSNLCNKQWLGKSLTIELRPKTSGNRVVADKPNDSVVTSDHACTTD